MQPFTFFISYRRQDTAPIALLLKYEIEKRLQFVRVSVDVEEIRHGDSFPDRIKELIGKAHATIVLIGKNWMARSDQSTTPSSMPDANALRHKDWVCEELQHSLANPIACDDANSYNLTKRVILPIFVDCEQRFDQFELPKELEPITTANAEKIDYAHWPSTIGPLIDRLATKFSLKNRSSDVFPDANPVKARTQPAEDVVLATTLAYDDYEGWYLDNFGKANMSYLVKDFVFDSFDQAANFMHLVANHCRVLGHHPEWRNVHTHVTVSLTTWDARHRVTIYDLNLALFMNKAARAVLDKD